MTDSKEIEISKLPYKEYLQTDHWKNLRKSKLKQSGFKCQLCSSNKELHVHHNTYERKGYEYLSDLVVLCGNCHAKFHDVVIDDESKGLTDKQLKNIIEDDKAKNNEVKEKKIDYFIKIPNRFFYKVDNDTIFDGLIKSNEYNHKLLLVWCYLNKNKNILGVSNVTLEDMITSLGYKIDRKPKGSNERFLKILMILKEDGLIDITNSKLNKIKPKTFLKIKTLNITNEFTKIYLNDVDSIFKLCNKNDFDFGKMLSLYAYIGSFSSTKGNLTNLKVSYCTYSNISYTLGLVSETIKKYINRLEQLDLLLMFNFGRYIINEDKSHTYASNNLYIVKRHFKTQSEITAEVEKYKNAYKQNFPERKFIGGDISYKMRKFYGKLTSLRVKKDKGTITDMEITTLNNMEIDYTNHKNKVNNFEYSDEKYNQ